MRQARAAGGALRRQAVAGARLRVPDASGFARSRLQSVLDSLGDNRLGLVVAPAGSGKTTLLARWVRGYPGAVAWYRADSADVVVPGIAPRLGAALECALAGRASRTGTATTAQSVEDIAVFAEQIAEQVLLVVDDVHELAGSPAMADLERLVLLAPPNLQVWLSTRMMPTINLARSELAQPLVIVGDDLRFRSWEVEGLFRDFYGEPLRPDDAAALARRTDGWAAALQLFHLATAGRGQLERSRSVRSLTGRAHYAQEYLSGQVLAGLPDELRELLRRTCVFDVVTGARCDELLGDEGNQRALEELARRQALTTSDDGGETFRYHEVLRRHLETSLYEELGNAGMQAWYCRAAEILEADGAVVEALRARCRGGDWPNVRRLLHEDGARLDEDGVTDWAELLPAWLAQVDPWVALAEARRLLDDGQLAAAESAARRAADQFTDATGKQLCRAVVRTAGAWLGGPQRVDARWADVLRAAMNRDPGGQLAAAAALDPPFAEFVEGAVLVMTGDLQGAMAALARAARADDLRVALAARLITCAFAGWMDSYSCEERELDAICLATERHGLTWLSRVSRAVALAFAGAADEVRQAWQIAADCAERGDPWGALLIGMYLATSELYRGRPDLSQFDAVIGACHALGAATLEACARCWRAVAAAALGHPEAEHDARAAEAFTCAAKLPGALPLVYGALAAASSHDRTELGNLAESTRLETGLDCRPWLWAAAGEEQAARGHSRTAEATGPAIEVSCFGPFRLSVAGVAPELACVRPRARALLRLLAMHAGQPVHRERLADELWPDLNADAAIHNLQVAISALRRALQPMGGESLIARHGDAYLLVLGETGRSDVREFEAQLAAAAQAKAGGDHGGAADAFWRVLEHYTGALLAEDGAAEWVLEARERYRLLAAEAAASLAALEAARGDLAAAARAAGRGVQIDRYNDASWRALIRAHRERGDHAAAQRAQQSYHAMLESLGVPMPLASSTASS